MITNKRIAPIVAEIITPNIPVTVKPKKPNTKLLNMAPMIPTMISPKRPNPFPFIMFPASHPANAPIAKNMIKLVTFMISPVNYTASIILHSNLMKRDKK